MMINDNKQFVFELQDFLSTDPHFLSKTGGRLLGIDYGSVRIGLALSDKERRIATPFKIIFKLKELDDIVPSKEISGFVVGLPLQTDGQEGFIAGQVRLFCHRLIEKYQLPVVLVDERYTSKYAAEAMSGRGVRLKRQKEVLDAEAAARILQKALNVLMVK